MIDYLFSIEGLAVSTGLASVWFSVKERIWVYPIGLISVSIYVYLSFIYGIYADMGINIYYVLMSIYGWYRWLQPSESSAFKEITHNSRKEWLLSIVLFLLSWVILFVILQRFTDSEIPLWDSLTTSLAIVGMWLMAEKKVEHWLFWIATDLLSIPLYYYKDLLLTSGQFFVFTVLAVMGWFQWNQSLSNRNQNSKLIYL
ncbi:MAG: nicotinamide mononucleotide transporter [Balneola sp.]|nr:nicotinamide mononucleotide transporter [Balneola sp.]|tara:strand:+ start:10077 stop:10676 length:600 start_codon:yes stop_codon:yes gene_type:complete